jgi:hypothetical protein
MNDHLNNNCSPKDNTDLGVCFQLERYKYLPISRGQLQVSECRNRRNPPEKRNSIAIRRRLFVFSFLMSGLLNIYVKDVGKSQTSKATVLLDLFHRDTLASISVLEGTSIASHSRTKGSTAACQEAPPTILTATRPRKPTVHFNSR